MTVLEFTVRGIPGAQGSKRHMGHGVMVESSKKVKPWRSDVKAAAEIALERVDDFGEWPATGPCRAVIVFRFARPRSHYRTGRNAGQLRDGAPAWPVSLARGRPGHRRGQRHLPKGRVTPHDRLPAQLR